VAVIAVVGFVVGVAWPRLAGVRLGPSLPSTPSPVTSPSTVAPQPSAPEATPSSPLSSIPSAVASSATSADARIAPSTPSIPSVGVTAGTVLSCKTSEGESLKGADACGKPQGLDGVVVPRLRKLAQCPDAKDASGKLVLVVRLDLVHAALTVDLGRGQGVASPDLLLACARTELSGTPLASVVHDNPRYTVAYTVTFGASGRTATAAPSTSARAPSDEADGAAQIVWDVAIVRDAPKSGKVVARLPRGSAVRIGSMSDGWLPVKYGDAFASDGWVYRGAVGK
jgi:hypothetical protein